MIKTNQQKGISRFKISEPPTGFSTELNLPNIDSKPIKNAKTSPFHWKRPNGSFPQNGNNQQIAWQKWILKNDNEANIKRTFIILAIRQKGSITGSRFEILARQWNEEPFPFVVPLFLAFGIELFVARDVLALRRIESLAIL